MSFKGQLKSNIAAETRKLKGKPWKDKIWYIWEYYKFHIFGIITGTALIVSVGTTIYNNRFDTALSCLILNSSITEEGELKKDEYFNKGFRQFAKLDEDLVISIDNSLNVQFDNISSQFDYAAIAKITAMAAGHGLDVMIADPSSAGHYGSLGGYLDLKATLPHDLYNKVTDSLYWVKNEQGGSVACGVRLDQKSFEEKTGIILDEPIFAIMSNSIHTETAVDLLRYILE